MYEAKSGRPEVGYQLCIRGVEMTANAGLRWTEGEALASRAQIALRYSVGSPRADLMEAVRIGRESRSWFTVWLALGDGIPWMREYGFADLADTLSGYMDKRSIPFKAVIADDSSELQARPNRRRSIGANMHKDELVDYVLHELKS